MINNIEDSSISIGTSKKRKAVDNDNATTESETENINNNRQSNVSAETSNARATFSFEKWGSTVVDNSNEIILPLVEDMLAVPLEYIFREVPMTTTATTSTTRLNASLAAGSKQQRQKRRKPLLSRSEAHCFVQIHRLAHEIDSLTALSARALTQRCQMRDFSTALQSQTTTATTATATGAANATGTGTASETPSTTATSTTDRQPFLRPLVPLLHVLHEQQTFIFLHRVAMAFHLRLVQELQQIVVQLRQSSEQNWALSETLQDSAVAVVASSSTNHGPNSNSSTAIGCILAKEKRNLSDIQDELCQRIEALLHDNSVTSMPTNDDLFPVSTKRQSMREYCNHVFNGEPETNSVSFLSLENTKESAKDNNRDENTDSHVDRDDDDEILDEPSSAAVSPVSSAAPSPLIPGTETLFVAPTMENLVGPATTQFEISSTSHPPNSITRFHAVTSATRTPMHDTPKASLFRAALPLSELATEKENAPSQSSSSQQSSSLVGFDSVLATAAAAAESENEEHEELGFQSQGAAQVLSTLAASTFRNARSYPT